MFPEYQLREQHFVVIQTLSDCIKAGPADPQKLPQITIPYGDQKPLIRGHIEDWDALDRFWHMALKALHIKKSRNHSPILLTVPSTISRSQRERIVQMFFEKYNAPGLYIADYPLMVMYGFGRILTGLVIDVDSDCTIVTPIIDTVLQTHAILVLPVGSSDIRSHLKSLLLADSLFQASLAANSMTEISEDLMSHIETDVIEMSHLQLETDRKKEKDIQRFEFEFNGRKFSIGDGRVKAVEILFNPKAVGKGGYSLAEVIYESIMKCDLDKRVALLDHTMLSGSFCKIKGFKSRLEKEVKKLLPQTDFCNEYQPKDIKFLPMPDYIEAYKGQEEHVAFLGAAVVAKLVFPDMKNYLTKLDYNESGPSIVQTKGF